MNPVNPDNEPKLPSFKPAQKKEEEKKKGASLPTGAGKEMPSFLKSFPKGTAPMMRVRGFGGGASLMERLKSLRKKDLAFIAAGLSVLVMAPLAEHFLMSPEDQAGQLQKGFSSNSAFPGDVGSIYDPGAGGFSPGGLLGQGSDVITPLNVRDPSALIMGPGATQKPSATVEAPPPPKSDAGGSWKDALTSAAQKGASAATRKASLPMPHPKMAAGMRGLGAVGGGGGGSYSLPGLSASNVPNRAAGSNSLMKVQAAPGFKGAASRSGMAGGGSEAMKAGAAKQGDIMNKGGSAGAALDNAAKEAIPGGKGFGGGGPGGGDETKNPGYAKPDMNKNIGESLAYLRQKMEMEKALDLKWKKKAWYEFERQKMIEESIIKSAIENLLGKGLFEPMGKAMGDLFGNLTGSAGPQGYQCFQVTGNGTYSGSPVTLSAAQMSDCKKQAASCQYIDPNKWKCFAYGGATSSGGEQAPGTFDTSAGQVGAVGPKGAAVQTNYTGEVLGRNFNEAHSRYDTSLNDLSNSVSKMDVKSDPKLAALQKDLSALQGRLGGSSAALSKSKEHFRNAVEKLKAANTSIGQARTKQQEFGTAELGVVANAGNALDSLSYTSKASGDKKVAFVKEDTLKAALGKIDSNAKVVDGAASQEGPLGEAGTAVDSANGFVLNARKTYDQAKPIVDQVVADKDKLVSDFNASAKRVAITPDSPILKSFSDARNAFEIANTKARIAVEGAEDARTKTFNAIKLHKEADAAITKEGKEATSSNSQLVQEVKAAAEKVQALKSNYEKSVKTPAGNYNGLDVDAAKAADLDALVNGTNSKPLSDAVNAADKAAFTTYLGLRDEAKSAIETARKTHETAGKTMKAVGEKDTAADDSYRSKEKGAAAATVEAATY